MLLVAALTAAACASTTVSAAGGPDSPVSTSIPPGSGGPPAGQKPKVVTPQPGLQSVTPLTWIKAIPSSDGKTMTITFWGGPCMGIDHVGVDDASDAVTVTLYQGTPPSLVGSACPEIAMLMAVRVGLSSPLDGRTVVDGSL